MISLDQFWRAVTSTEPAVPGPEAAQPFSSVVIDSRAAEPGSLFIALRGEHTDGHLYLGDAFTRGARAALAEPHARELYPQARFVTPDGTVSGDAGPWIFIVPDSLAGLQAAAHAWRVQMPADAVAITGSVGKTHDKGNHRQRARAAVCDAPQPGQP